MSQLDEPMNQRSARTNMGFKILLKYANIAYVLTLCQYLILIIWALTPLLVNNDYSEVQTKVL